MPQVEILIKTKAELAELRRAADELKRKGDIAVDVTKKLEAMDKAEQAALKTQRVFGDQSAQMADHVSKLTKEAKAAGSEAEKTTGIKARWLDATKKLTGAIPGLSFVLGALKNPLVAIIAVIAIAIDAFEKMKQRIEEMREAVGDGKITEQFTELGKILAGSKVEAAALADELDRIANRPEDVDEQNARLKASLSRRLSAAAAADEKAKARELAGATTPEEKGAIEFKYEQRAAAREQSRLGGEADIALQGKFRSRDVVRELEAQAPEQLRILEQAKLKKKRAFELATGHESSDLQLTTMEKQIKELDDILNTPFVQRSYTQLQLTSGYHGDQGIRDAKSLYEANLAAARQGNVKSGEIRELATGELDAAQGRYSDFRARLLGAQNAVRRYGREYSEASSTFEAFQPINAPGAGLQSAQQRHTQAKYEVQAAKIGREAGTISAEEFEAAVKAAVKAYTDVQLEKLKLLGRRQSLDTGR